MSNAWTEREHGDSIHLEFTGFDGQKRDAQELARFQARVADDPLDSKEKRSERISSTILIGTSAGFFSILLLPMPFSIIMFEQFVLAKILKNLKASASGYR